MPGNQQIKPNGLFLGSCLYLILGNFFLAIYLSIGIVAGSNALDLCLRLELV